MADVAKQLERIWENAMKVAEPKIKEACYEMCKSLYITAYKDFEFYGVTGNTHNSLIVGCYERGKLLCSVSAEDMGVKGETRPTLKRFEKYDLPQYWSGAYVQKGRRFSGKAGTENYSGRDRAKRLLWTASTNKNVPYRFVIGVAVDYARYIETKRGKNVLTRLHDELKTAGANVSRMHYT